jgi:hypothetical protein
MQDTKEPQPEQKPEQPVQPQQNFGPAPVDPNTQYQQQPVNQQYFAQPQAAPVQYVVMAPSLKGVKGWLLFFTICFALSGIGYISLFFASMTDLSSPSAILSLVFSPLLAAGSLATTVLIAMQKKLGKWLAVGTLGLYALNGVINSIVAFSSGTSSESTAPALLSAIIIGLVMEGLFMLYFFVSKRVKETLVN